MEKNHEEKDVKVRSLYDEALERFRKEALESHSTPKEVEVLNEFLQERSSPEETKKAAETLQADAGKKWGSKKVGDMEIPASWISMIMDNIEHFITAGDHLTNNAPESVGIAWYAIKLTLTAVHSNYELYNFFGSGLGDVTEIMLIIRHYDRLYDERHKPGWKASPLVDKLFQDVMGAYVAVLNFSYAIKRHLTAGALTRIKHGFKDFFGLSKAKFEDKLAAIATLKKKVLEESQAAFQDKTLTGLQNVSDVLSGIKASVRRIQDFQETQKKLHDEAMARFDQLLKGFDEVRASTKRKTQWDYALQDYQAFRDLLSPLEGQFEILGENLDRRYPGTCEWVFEETLYTEFIENDTDLLCVTGLDGSGKTQVVATVVARITRDIAPDTALLYVSCNPSTVSGSNGGEMLTADRICRTILAQLYELAVQGEANVGLLETCNAMFKKHRQSVESLPRHMRGGSSLPEFGYAFHTIAGELKKDLLVVIDNLNQTSLEEEDQELLLRNVNSLIGDDVDDSSYSVKVLCGCASNTKFFAALDLASGQYIDVQANNRADIELVVVNALKTIPGLTAEEQEEAKQAILDKARGRFAYVVDTALPFMREPFKRPIANRLAQLPDGISDVYAKVLEKMSPNYVELLRTALTWTLLSDEYPGLPHAREIMDAFQGTYDVDAPDVDLDDVEDFFDDITALELEQLRQAVVPFLTIHQDDDGPVWVWEAHGEALHEYFLTDHAHSEEELEDPSHLCARCGTIQNATKSLKIDRKQGQLQMALTCLRHLNNRLFQHKAGLLERSWGNDRGPETDGGEAPDNGGSPNDEGAMEDAAQPDSDAAQPPDYDALLEEARNEYDVESSVDDEDVVAPRVFEKASEGLFNSKPLGEEKHRARVRYELQFWPFHLLQAQSLWSPEEQETNEDWIALMEELDRFAFDTPEVFAAWQGRFPDPQGKKNPLFHIGGPTHKPLHIASYLALDSWVSHLLKRGEEVDQLSDGFTPLQAAACSKRSFSTMRLLMDNGADINDEAGKGYNAFQFWLNNGDVTEENTRTLLEQYKADPKAHSSATKCNALQTFALKGEDPEILDLFLDHGVGINEFSPEDPLALSPLHYLLIRPNVPLDLLKAFIKNKADVDHENKASARPLQMVCHTGKVENLKVLLESDILEVDDADLHGTTALHEAALFGHEKCVAVLVERKADPDIPDKVNRVAMHSAALAEHVEVVRILVKHSKKLNLFDNQGWTPLFCACLRNNEESALLILDVLIENNIPLAEINHPTRTRRTVLRQAAEHGFDNVVAKLIKLAVDCNDKDNLGLDTQDTKKGMAALHRAAMFGRTECVKLLVEAGADVTLRDKEGYTALQLACERWGVETRNPAYEEILELLISKNPADAAADADLVAMCAANGSVTLLQQLHALNAPLNRPDKYGWTPLNLAKRFGHDEAVTFLKRQGAWSDLLPSRWMARYPGTTAAGAQSIAKSDPTGRTIVHTSGKRLCISADKPIPLGLETYYFEVTLQEVPPELKKKKKPASAEDDGDPEYPEMAIGLCTLGGAAVPFPGWWNKENDEYVSAESWGYHSDVGAAYSSQNDFGDDGDDELRYRIGDTVGCGVDLTTGWVWFTKNGVRVTEGVKMEADGRLFPVVGLHEDVAFVTNFGKEGEPFSWQPGQMENEADGEEESEGEYGEENEEADDDEADSGDDEDGENSDDSDGNDEDTENSEDEEEEAEDGRSTKLPIVGDRRRKPW
ncbi:hypothetical protein VTJ83DRAFT_3119 [Remersonia thermophila]|uniref:B30.2/SPRY domain-containing protein n=1 Tax=Remersonia thermophila TaxID=72144 RepID=A0ABR4DD44_9PEZI